MTEELIVYDHTNVPVSKPVPFLDMELQAKIKFATQAAGELKQIIDRQHLYSDISGQRHVKVEGWLLLGNFLGILPKEDFVKEHEDGTFEARVSLVNVATGIVIGAGSAICAPSEKRWKTAEKYARRSMAITRATSKAYRSSFSWVMSFAGYQPTPAEEMDFLEPAPTPPPAPQEPEKYSKLNSLQQRRLEKLLESLKCPPELAGKVEDILEGKEMLVATVQKIISEVSLANGGH